MTPTGARSTLRTILRGLRRNPATTAAVVLSLAMAIAGSAVIFSAIDTVQRLVPARERDRMVYVASTNPQRGESRTRVSVPDFVDWSEQARSFEALTAFSFGALNLTGVETPLRVSAVQTSANLPSAWGIEAIIGRTFRLGEDAPGAERVVLLTSRFWHRQFAGDRDVPGRVLVLNGNPHTVVGVTSPEADTGIFAQADVIVPLVLDPARASRGERTLLVVGLLAPGVARVQSGAELADIARRLEAEHPGTNTGVGVVVRPLVELSGQGMAFVSVLLGIVAAFLLLIACANVASVLMAYWTGRRREFAIRAALGASRGRLVRHLMIEGLVLSSLAGATGLLIAVWALALIRSISGGGIPLFGEMAIDARALGFGGLVSVVLPFVFAWLPAFRSAAPGAGELRNGQLVAGGARGGRFRQILVAGQVALACLLAIEIALFVRTAWNLARIEEGFDPRNLLTLRLELPEDTYAGPPQVAEFVDALVQRIEGLPGVESAAAIDRLPIANRERDLRVVIEGQPVVGREALPGAARAAVTPGYLRTMKIPLHQGRAFRRADAKGARLVAIVNREMVRRHWPAGDAVGRRIRFESEPEGRWVEIVGIAGDVRGSDADAGPIAQVYVPAAQFPERTIGVVVRTEGSNPAGLTPSIRGVVAQLDPDLPIFAVATMEQLVFADLGGTYMLVGILAAVTLVAMALAAGGIYGLIAYSVSQRTREIGIRLALGAEPRAVVAMMQRRGALAACLGGLIGLGGGFALAYVTSGALTEVDPGDPVGHGVVVFLLAGVVLLASYLPARRALRVDPIVALRAD